MVALNKADMWTITVTTATLVGNAAVGSIELDKLARVPASGPLNHVGSSHFLVARGRELLIRSSLPFTA